jgi:crotonyl-CoA reductase
MLIDQAALKPAATCSCGARGRSRLHGDPACRLYGANAIAVVSSEDKADLCRRLGAHAVINRRDYDLPGADSERTWTRSSASQGDPRGDRGVDCDIVFEHVGSATFFPSVFVCRTFGKI